MICLLYYRFSASPVLPTLVATKAGALANNLLMNTPVPYLQGAIMYTDF